MADTPKKPEAENADSGTDLSAPNLSAGTQVLVIEPVDKTIEQILAVMSKDSDTEIHRSTSDAECVQIAMMAAPCLALLSIASKEDIIRTTSFLKQIQELVRAQHIKIILLSKFNDKRVSDTYFQLGCNEFVQHTISPNTLYFKVKLHAKSMRAKRKAVMEELKVKSIRGAGPDEATEAKIKGEAAEKAGPKVVQVAEDIWIFRGEKPKKVGMQWIVSIDGPDPFSGDWVEGIDEATGKPRWIWKGRSESGDDVPLKDLQSGWSFNGQKPLFNPDTGKWKFVGSKPTLSHFKKGQGSIDKMAPDGRGGIAVAPDAPDAEKNLEKLGEIAAAAKQKRKMEGNLEKDGSEKDAGVKASIAANDEEDEEEKPELNVRKIEAEQSEEQKQGKGQKPGAIKASAQENNAAEEERKLKKLADNLQPGKSLNAGGDENGKAGAKTPGASATPPPIKSSLLQKDEAQAIKSAGAGKSTDTDEKGAFGKKKTAPTESKEKDELKEWAKELDSDNGKSPTDRQAEERAKDRRERRKARLESGHKPDLELAKAALGIKDPKDKTQSGEEAAEQKSAEALKRAAEAQDGEASAAQKKAAAQQNGAANSANPNSNGHPSLEETSPHGDGPLGSASGANSKASQNGLNGLSQATANGTSESTTHSSKADRNSWRAKNNARKKEEEEAKKHGATAARDKKTTQIGERSAKRKGENGDRQYVEYPAGHFGSEHGVWYAVEEQGFIFVVPEVKTATPDSVKLMFPFWFVDAIVEAPFFCKDSKSWLFRKEAQPKMASTFGELLFPYANFLISMAQSKSPIEAIQENRALLEQDAKRTESSFDKIDSPSSLKSEEAAKKFVENFKNKRKELQAEGKIKPQDEESIKTARPEGSLAALAPQKSMAFFVKLSDKLGRKDHGDVARWLALETSQHLGGDTVVLIALLKDLQPHVAGSSTPEFVPCEKISLDKHPQLQGALSLATKTSSIAQPSPHTVVITLFGSIQSGQPEKPVGLFWIRRKETLAPFNSNEMSFLQRLAQTSADLLQHTSDNTVEVQQQQPAAA